MPVEARQHIKRMRGGANAHLMLADDDAYYVVKFRNNPQHQRVIVNEVLCYSLLDHLGLPTPGWDVVNVPEDLVRESPELVLEAGRRIIPCEPGRHFGSRFPVDPSTQAVYDYVPLSMLRDLLNVDAFLGMVPFDKWISNANGRQAVFYRDRAANWLSDSDEDIWIAGKHVTPRSLVYVANMIDHGFAFNAHRWDFSQLPEQGIYTRREVYENVRGIEAFEPWLSRIENLSTDVLDDAQKRIPAAWYDDSWDELESLLERLYRRRKEVADLVRNAKQAALDPFPNWTMAVSAAGGA